MYTGINFMNSSYKQNAYTYTSNILINYFDFYAIKYASTLFDIFF